MKKLTALILLSATANLYLTFALTVLIFLLFSALAYGIYKLTLRLINRYFKRQVNSSMFAAVILMTALFLTEITVTKITIYQVNKQLGFEYTTVRTPKGKIFTIVSVTPGKAMDKAGFEPDDVVQLDDVNELYKLLIDNQTRKIIIPVVRGRKEINIRVKIPDLYVPLARVAFLF